MSESSSCDGNKKGPYGSFLLVLLPSMVERTRFELVCPVTEAVLETDLIDRSSNAPSDANLIPPFGYKRSSHLTKEVGAAMASTPLECRWYFYLQLLREL